jgi:very-short-patch-repair endonuclease
VDQGRERAQRSIRAANLAADDVLPAQRAQRRAEREIEAESNKLPDSDPRGGPTERIARAGPTERIARAATAQRGVLTRQQLGEAGLERSAIGRRATDGTLHRIHRGVYLVGHQARAPLARETAALLAAGEGAVISHVSAAALWSMVSLGADEQDVHVTVSGRKLRSRAGLRVHQTSGLLTADIRHRSGVLLTAPARTLLDLAASRSKHTEQAFIEAHGLGLLRVGELQRAVRRWEGRPGVPALRALMEGHVSGYTRSKAELAMRKLLHGARLPEPAVNAPLHGYLIDFLWPAERLVLEIDGFAFHGHRRAFENDRRRDATLVASGYRVIRVTWRQLTEEPLAVVATLASALTTRVADNRAQG